MTALTQNLPWFIRDPAVSLIGESCYRSLIEQLHFGDTACLKLALSKGVGIGIVLGGSIMKVPQVFLILRARSAAGLSLPSFALETAAYAITLAYAHRSHFPFSTYGENLFLAAQNALITVLIVYFPSTAARGSLWSTRGQGNTGGAALAALALLAASYALLHAPAHVLALLQASTLPLALIAKLPQITQNHHARSTGQLSAFAVGAQVAGCAARLFTTGAETGDALLFISFALALALNVVLAVQMWAYWGRGVDAGQEYVKVDVKEDGYELREKASAGKVDIFVPPQAPIPPPSSPQPGRRWARKVD